MLGGASRGCLRCAATLVREGILSVAVVLKHAAIYPTHEQLVGQLAREMGFTQARARSCAYAVAVC